MHRLEGLSSTELRELRELIKVKLSDVRDEERDAREMERDTIVDRVNALIDEGTLVKGSEVNIRYKNEIVVATIVTSPTEKSKSLKVHSDSFDTKDGTRYAPKHMVVID
jgi:acetyl-CoA carboxylase carboxyltransferase component